MKQAPKVDAAAEAPAKVAVQLATNLKPIVLEAPEKARGREAHQEESSKTALAGEVHHHAARRHHRL